MAAKDTGHTCHQFTDRVIKSVVTQHSTQPRTQATRGQASETPRSVQEARLQLTQRPELAGPQTGRATASPSVRGRGWSALTTAGGGQIHFERGNSTAVRAPPPQTLLTPPQARGPAHPRRGQHRRGGHDQSASGPKAIKGRELSGQGPHFPQPQLRAKGLVWGCRGPHQHFSNLSTPASMGLAWRQRKERFSP